MLASNGNPQSRLACAHVHAKNRNAEKRMLDRLERGWVDAHANLGVERKGAIAPVWQVSGIGNPEQEGVGISVFSSLGVCCCAGKLWCGSLVAPSGRVDLAGLYALR